jgi:hypothetical protein
MEASTLKKVIFLFLLGGLLLLTGCTTAEPLWKAGPASPGPWWQGKPWSQMTPAEQEEQGNPEFWFFWATEHGIGP